MNLSSEEINEIKYYREKIAREYKESVELKAKMDAQVEKSRKSLAELDKMKGIVVGKLDIELKEKQAELDDFKKDKTEFIEKLREREIEIKHQSQRLETEFAKIQDWKELKAKEQKKLAGLNEEVRNKIVDFDRKAKDVDIVLFEIKQSQDQTRQELAKAKDNAEKAEEQLNDQLRITQELEAKRKRLNLKVEAQEKSGR